MRNNLQNGHNQLTPLFSSRIYTRITQIITYTSIHKYREAHLLSWSADLKEVVTGNTERGPAGIILFSNFPPFLPFASAFEEKGFKFQGNL